MTFVIEKLGCKIFGIVDCGCLSESSLRKTPESDME